MFRQFARLVTTGLVSTMMVSLTPAAIASAHEDDAATGIDHANEDLAGVPIESIERQTKQNASDIARTTGVYPGDVKTQRRAADVTQSAEVAANPGVGGAWSDVVDTPVVPVFQAVLPNGKVLMWDSVGDNAAETYPDHSFTRAMVWNPADNTNKRVDVVGYNIFCAGYSQLANGNVLVAGGNKDKMLAGIVQTHIFDWRTETWSRGPNMASGRWYPSVTVTANGEASIIGGGPTVAEVYQTNNTIRQLPGFDDYGNRAYPFVVSRPDTQISLLGPFSKTFIVNTAGTGTVIQTKERDGKARDYGSFATYDIGRTLVAGGGNFTEGGKTNVPTRTAVVFRNYGTSTATDITGAMAVGRRQFNLTVLADGTVAATGGETSVANSSLVDLTNAQRAAEIWNPATGEWTLMASASRIRQYHSTATLLPDGRLLTGGGGVCGTCMSAGYLEKNIEYFSPPYLYKHDGSGELAIRPAIVTAPATVAINKAFTVTSPDAAAIRKMGIVRLGAATHGDDQGQRYVPLAYSVSDETITVTGPGTGGIAPPGYYMLFATNDQGVPSVAKIVQVLKGPNPIGSRARNGSGNCLDLPGARTVDRTYFQTYACNGSGAQALTTLPNDQTLRVLGKCVDVQGAAFTSGTRVWLYACNGSVAQRWVLNADQTIRPTGNTKLCLAASSTAARAQVQINTCNGSSLQKWAT